MEKIKEYIRLLKNRIISRYRLFKELRKDREIFLKKVQPYELDNYFKIMSEVKGDISFYNKILKVVLKKEDLKEFIETKRILDKKVSTPIHYGDFFMMDGVKFFEPDLEYKKLIKRYIELLFKIEKYKMMERDGDGEFILSVLTRVRNETRKIILEIKIKE